MLYVFTFLGEFGFELLNWQGVVRKFALSLPPEGRIVCCSRAQVHPLYERAAAYLDISEVPRFRESRAVRYWVARSRDRLTSLRDLVFDRSLKGELRAHIARRLLASGLRHPGERCRFVFSSDGVRLGGCSFGAVGYRYRPHGVLVSDLCAVAKGLLSAPVKNALRRGKTAILDRAPALDYRADGDIYAQLDVANNEYRRIEADLSVRADVEGRLGWSLDEPFLLVQGRRRDNRQASGDLLPDADVADLLGQLAGEIRVVLLDFSTGRWLDSYSALGAAPNAFRYPCRTFPEQACLVHFARHCLFFTEGDLGSHTYVPPLMGRDVTVVAPPSVFELESAPVDFWNRNVFRFGGAMIPEPWPDPPRDGAALRQRVRSRLCTALGA